MNKRIERRKEVRKGGKGEEEKEDRELSPLHNCLELIDEDWFTT